MPTFDFLPLLWWGLPLAAAPVVIHLINLLRLRRVPWAAMEFLLASQKKYRTRVLLKQILLLALRVAAVLGIVCALAQPRWRSALGRMLGGAATTHVILLDDSYSMGDLSAESRIGETTCFDRGRLVVERICAELAAAPGVHKVALGRFSPFDRPAADAPAEGTETRRAPPDFDVPLETVSPRLVQGMRDELAALAPSATAAAPRASLAAAAALLGPGAGAARVLWLVTDFRLKDWRAAEETTVLLRRLADEGCEVRLVDCGPEDDGRRPGNLSVERLERVGGMAAKDVLLPLEVAVRNHSDRPVRDVVVTLREDGLARPGVRIGEIPAVGSAPSVSTPASPRRGRT